MKLGFIIAKLKAKLSKPHVAIIDYYRKRGVKIGENCLICSSIVTKEPFLLQIGSNTAVSTNVTFVTHNNCA